MSKPVAATSLPWFRQGWPWFLISFPLASVVLGISLLVIAINSDDALVVDDYYKEGRAINQRIARDEAAALLGVSARIERAPQGTRLALSLAPPSRVSRADGAALQMPVWTEPPMLSVRWVHVTDAEHDRTLRFESLGQGLYVSSGELPAHERGRLHLEEPSGAWRLVSGIVDFGADGRLHLEPPSLSRFPGLVSGDPR